MNPQIVGGSSGDTTITSFVVDFYEDVYYGGTSTDTAIVSSSSGAPFVGCLDYGGTSKWIVEVIGGTHTSVIDISKDGNNNIYFVLDQHPIVIGTISYYMLQSAGISAWYVSPSSASSSQLIQGGVSGYDSGALKFLNLAIQSESETWQILGYNITGALQMYSYTTGNPQSTAYIVSNPYTTYQLIGGIINDGTTTYTSLSLVDRQYGNLTWHYGIAQTTTPYYYVRRLGMYYQYSIGGCAEKTTPGNLLLFRLGLSTANLVTTSDVYEYVDTNNYPMTCLSMNMYSNTNMQFIFFETTTQEMRFATFSSSNGTAYTFSTLHTYTELQGFIMTMDDNNTCAGLTNAFGSGSATASSYSSSFVEITYAGLVYDSTTVIGQYWGISVGANYSNVNYTWPQRTWCQSKVNISLIPPAQSNITCYNNISGYVTPNAGVTGNTSTCSDMSKLVYNLYYYGTNSQYVNYVAWAQQFSCSFKYLPAYNQEMNLLTSSSTYLTVDKYFYVIYPDECGSEAVIDNSYITDLTYKVTLTPTYQQVYNFSISGAINSNECYIDDTSFSIWVDPNCSAITLNKTSTSNYKMSVYTIDYTLVRNYTVYLVQHLNIYNYSVSAAVNVEIKDNCDLATIISKSVSDYSYDINEYTNNTIDSTTWNQSVVYCETKYPIQYYWTVAPSTSIMSFTSLKNISIYTNSILDVGVYNLSVVGTTYGAYNFTMYNQTYINFTVNVTNNCPTMSITTQSLSNCVSSSCSYTVGHPSTSYTFADWVPEYSYCYNASYYAYYTDTGDISSYYSPDIVFDNSSRTLTVVTKNILMSGVYNLTINGTYPNGSSSTYNFSLTIVNPCPTATLSYTQKAQQNYTLQHGLMSVFSNTYSSTQNSTICGNWFYIYEVDSLIAPYLTYSDTSLDYIQIISSDEAIAGTYTINVTAYQGVNGFLNNKTTSFVLKIMDPCRSITLWGPSISSQVYNISATQMTVYFTKFNDSLGICGDYTYEATYQGGSAYDSTIFSFNFTAYSFSIYTETPSQIGSYPLQINGTMPYGYGTKLVNFTVTINCVVQNITSPDADDGTNTNFTYFIGSGFFGVTFTEFVQWPLCNYTFKYYNQPAGGTIEYPNLSETLPSTFTFLSNNRELSLDTSTTADMGIYVIGVNGTLQDKYKTSNVSLTYQIIVVSTPPKFITPLEDVVMNASDTLYVSLPIAENSFGEPALITAFIYAVPFIRLESDQFVLRPTFSEVGFYDISIVVADKTYTWLATSYLWQVTVLSMVDISIYKNITFTQNSSASSSSQTIKIVGSSQNQNSSSEISINSNSAQKVNTSLALTNLSEILSANLTNYQLSAEIKSISKTALVTIKFSQNLITPTNFLWFNSSILQLSVIPSSESNASLLDFNWTMVSFKDSIVTLQLSFTDPLQVSKYAADKLKINIIGNAQFEESDDILFIQYNYQMEKDLPNIMLNNTMSNLLSSMGGPLSGILNALSISSIFMNIFLAGVLQYVWGMINCLQIIVNIPIISVQMPANAVYMYSTLINFVQFNIIPTNGLYSDVFNFTNTDPFNSNFDDLDIFQNTITPSFNLNSTTIWMHQHDLEYGEQLPLYYRSSHCLCGAFIIQNAQRQNKNVKVSLLRNEIYRFKKAYDYTSKNLFFGTILRFLLQNYLSFSICAILNMYQLLFTKPSDIFVSSFAIFQSALLLLFPVFVSLFLVKNFNKLSDVKFQEKYGTLYENIKIDSKLCVLFNFFFVLRRLVFVVTAFYFTNQPVYQIQLLTLQCALMVVYLGMVQPFKSLYDNVLESFNEICILGISYHLCIFTDFVPEDNLQYNGGWSVIILTLLNLLVNSILIIRILILQLKAYITRYCKIKKWKRTQKYVQEQKLMKKNLMEDSLMNNDMTQEIYKKKMNKKMNKKIKGNKLRKNQKKGNASDQDYNDNADQLKVTDFEANLDETTNTMLNNPSSSVISLRRRRFTKKDTSDIDDNNSKYNDELYRNNLHDFFTTNQDPLDNPGTKVSFRGRGQRSSDINMNTSNASSDYSTSIITQSKPVGRKKSKRTRHMQERCEDYQKEGAYEDLFNKFFAPKLARLANTDKTMSEASQNKKLDESPKLKKKGRRNTKKPIHMEVEDF